MVSLPAFKQTSDFCNENPHKPVVKRNHSFFPATARLANDARGARKLQDLTVHCVSGPGWQAGKGNFFVTFLARGGGSTRRSPALSICMHYSLVIKSDSKRLSLLRTRVVVSKHEKHEKARVKALSLNLRGCLDTHKSNSKSSLFQTSFTIVFLRFEVLRRENILASCCR